MSVAGAPDAHHGHTAEMRLDLEEKDEDALRAQLAAALKDLASAAEETRGQHKRSSGASLTHFRKHRNLYASRVSRIKKKLSTLDLNRKYIDLEGRVRRQEEELALYKAALARAVHTLQRHEPLFTCSVLGPSAAGTSAGQEGGNPREAGNGP